jgi:hypothetical protein
VLLLLQSPATVVAVLHSPIKHYLRHAVQTLNVHQVFAYARTRRAQECVILPLYTPLAPITLHSLQEPTLAIIAHQESVVEINNKKTVKHYTAPL